jgi:hypothetical protein
MLMLKKYLKNIYIILIIFEQKIFQKAIVTTLLNTPFIIVVDLHFLSSMNNRANKDITFLFKKIKLNNKIKNKNNKAKKILGHINFSNF